MCSSKAKSGSDWSKAYFLAYFLQALSEEAQLSGGVISMIVSTVASKSQSFKCTSDIKIVV